MVRCGSSARQGPVLRRARVYSQSSIPKNTIGELDEPWEGVLLEILHAKDGTIQATPFGPLLQNGLVVLGGNGL